MLYRLASLPRPTPVAPEPTGDERAAVDTRSVEELLAALQEPGQGERRVAALALGLRGDPRAVEPLIAATRDRSQWVRMAAVRSLGKLKDPRALEALAERLRQDRDKEVRRSAATALRLLKDRRAVEALTIGLTDEHWRVAEAAEKALRALKAAPRVDILIDLLRTGDRERRHAAAMRLGDQGDRAAVAPLLEVAENAQEAEWLRVQALDAAAKLDAPNAAEVARRILQARVGDTGMNSPVELVCKAAGVSALAGDATAQPALRVLLDHANPYVRLAVVQALGALGDESAIAGLEQIQQRDHATVQVDPSGMQRVRLRNAAAEAIVAIRTRAAAQEQQKE
jgi:HEAT repeat protein